MTSTAANVENKVILITGGAQGIGGAAAQLCAQRGAEVIITDIKDETGEALAASLRAEGCKARYATLDVRRHKDAQAGLRGSERAPRPARCPHLLSRRSEGPDAVARRLPRRRLRRGAGRQRARRLPLRKGGLPSARGQRARCHPPGWLGRRRHRWQLFNRLRHQQGRRQWGWE